MKKEERRPGAALLHVKVDVVDANRLRAGLHARWISQNPRARKLPRSGVECDWSHSAEGRPNFQCDFPAAGGTWVWSVIQFTSQVLPPSPENACSKCGVLVLSRVHSKRTKMSFPFSVSVP